MVTSNPSRLFTGRNAPPNAAPDVAQQEFSE